MNLTEEYSYLGRSGRLPSQGGYGYYVLLYGKTEAEGALGHQRLSLKLRLACDTYSSFYNWQSAGYARVGDRTVLEWNISPKPDRAWEQSTLEAGGYAYPRWVDLAEGALLLETGFDGALTETLTWGYQVLDTYEGAWFPQDHFAVSGRVTVTLPALPGATVPQAAATGTLGQPLTITLTPGEDDFTHSLTWRFGQRSGTLGENLTGSLQFTPPLALAEEIPGAPSGILTLECSTWQGETLIGTAATPVTLGVPESLGPTVTAEWSDPTGGDHPIRRRHPVHGPDLGREALRLRSADRKRRAASEADGHRQPGPHRHLAADINGTALRISGNPYRCFPLERPR